MKLPYDLKQEFIKGNMILFVGAGFVKNYFSDMPNWQTLLEDVFKQISNDPQELYKYINEPIFNEKKEKIIPPQFYLRLAQLFENIREAQNIIRKKKNHKPLESIHCHVRNIIEKKYESEKRINNLENKYIKKVCDLPLNIWLTTNYDCFIEECIYSEKDNVCVLKRPVTSGQFSELNNEKQILKIHGCFKHPHPETSIVITEDDYYRFLKEDKYFVNKLFTLFCEKTVVFLGYSLNDPNINMVYNDVLYDIKGFSTKESIQKSFSRIRPAYFISQEKITNEQKMYFKNKRIVYIEETPIEIFFKELVSVYECHQKYGKDIIQKINVDWTTFSVWVEELKKNELNISDNLPENLDKLLLIVELFYSVKAGEAEWKISHNEFVKIIHNTLKTIETICNNSVKDADYDILNNIIKYWKNTLKDKKSWYSKSILSIIESILLKNKKLKDIEDYIYRYFECLYYYDIEYRNWEDYEFMLERYIICSELAIIVSKTEQMRYSKYLFEQLKLAGRETGESWFSVEVIYTTWNKLDEHLWPKIESLIEDKLRYNDEDKICWLNHGEEMMKYLAPGKDYKKYLPRTS